jgi:hypothetical protein
MHVECTDNGDPEYKDSWHGIIGYTKLVEDTLSD